MIFKLICTGINLNTYAISFMFHPLRCGSRPFLSFFFCYSRKFKFYFIFKLYNIVLVLPNIEMNHQRYICVPHPEPSSLLPPDTLPLGRPSALSFNKS